MRCQTAGRGLTDPRKAMKVFRDLIADRSTSVAHGRSRTTGSGHQDAAHASPSAAGMRPPPAVDASLYHDDIPESRSRDKRHDHVIVLTRMASEARSAVVPMTEPSSFARPSPGGAASLAASRLLASAQRTAAPAVVVVTWIRSRGVISPIPEGFGVRDDERQLSEASRVQGDVR
jgi:hypothetical protein